MRFIKTSCFAALLAIFTVNGVYAFNIKDALKGLANSGSQTEQQGSASTGSAINSLIGNLLTTDKIQPSSLIGSWRYVEPAVTFKTDDLLKKAGGAATSTAIVGKLSPIYKALGVNKMTLVVNQDMSFEMKLRGIPLRGTIQACTETGSGANFVFCFQVVGKFNLGRVNSYVTKNALGGLNVMFDVSALMSIIEKVCNISGNSTLKAFSSLLGSYDGACAGFALKQ